MVAITGGPDPWRAWRQAGDGRTQRLPQAQQGGLKALVVVVEQADHQQLAKQGRASGDGEVLDKGACLFQQFRGGRGSTESGLQRITGELVQAVAIDAQALVQARVVGQVDLQTAVQRAVAEGFVHYRPAQAEDFPGQQARAGSQAEAVFQAGTGAGEADIAVGQPFQGGTFGQMEMLLEHRNGAGAAVELGRAGHGQQRVAAGLQVHVEGQAITADHAARGVQHIHVARRAFRVKRALHQKRSEMTSRTNTGPITPLYEAQHQLGAPARCVVRGWELFG